ncbi:hypothetical protein JCM8547_007097 [Rhodosporidiobolus lusitaniae]
MPLPDEKHRLAFPKIKDLYGYVTVDGEPLEVYGVEEKDSKVVTYIVAKEGKHFEVGFADLRSAATDNAVDIMSTARCTAHSLMTSKNDSLYKTGVNDERRFAKFQGRNESSTSVLPFLFAKLATTDDDDKACKTEAYIRGLGTIAVRHRRVENLRDGTTDNHGLGAPEAVAVHEITKKAVLSHQTGYGKAIIQWPSTTSSLDWVDREDSPLSVLEFRYRSRAILQFEDYIPASPTPEPSASPTPQPAQSPFPQPVAAAASPSLPQPAAGSSKPSALEERERLRQLKREKKRRSEGGAGSSSLQGKVKAEPGTEGARDLKRVKREEGEELERRKEEDRTRGNKTAVIDLCDSD